MELKPSYYALCRKSMSAEYFIVLSIHKAEKAMRVAGKKYLRDHLGSGPLKYIAVMHGTKLGPYSILDTRNDDTHRFHDLSDLP